MSNLVLVTGGTGKTGNRLVALLQEHGVPYRIASRRSATKGSACHFDWNEPATWAAALDDVTTVYLVMPPSGTDPARSVIDFTQSAIHRGASRFVLLSASLLPEGGPGAGQVHSWLQQNAAEWTVLRPSWFMQNFTEGQHLLTIRDEDAIYSAAEGGRVPFIDAGDIAGSAFAAVAGTKAPNADFILTGGRAISYDEVAEKISLAIGRRIAHRRIEPEDLVKRHVARSLPLFTAQVLATMDTAIAEGVEDRVTDSVEALTGRPSTTFDTFVIANASNWMRPRVVG